MEIRQSSLTPDPGMAETRQWPRTAPLPRQANPADRFQRLKRSTLVVLSVVVCVAFSAALATAVYYLASLIWKI
jgi:hypothetical protein